MSRDCAMKSEDKLMKDNVIESSSSQPAPTNSVDVAEGLREVKNKKRESKVERLNRLQEKLNEKERELESAVRHRNAASFAQRNFVDVVRHPSEVQNDKTFHLAIQTPVQFLEPGDDELVDGEEEFLL